MFLQNLSRERWQGLLHSWCQEGDEMRGGQGERSTSYFHGGKKLSDIIYGDRRMSRRRKEGCRKKEAVGGGRQTKWALTDSLRH